MDWKKWIQSPHLKILDFKKYPSILVSIMATIIEEIKLINVDVESNMNRLWIGQVLDNGDFKATWGRVRAGVLNGEGLQSKVFPGAGRSKLEEMKRQKSKKGYTEVMTVGGSSAGAKVQIHPVNGDLRSIAKAQLIKSSNPVLDKLIDRLVQANVHRITTSTQITFNSATGLFQTPLGVVTPEGITKARNLLVNLNQFVSRRDWTSSQMMDLTGQYLRIVPHDVGRKLSVEGIFPNSAAIQKESDILDSLEASYQALQTQKPQATTTGTKLMEKVFAVDLDVLHDDRERRRIVDWYEKSKKDMHNYGHIKVREIFTVNIHDMTNAYEEQMKPHQEVFHGSSQSNALSILKSGLKVSPPSTAAIAGKLFGNGLYGATCSTKSLGYTFGRWGQGGVGDSGWLWICYFALGKVFETKAYGCSKPSGYDSIWAKASPGGLHNDEIIVYRNSQVKIKYLLECK